jgi:hypothetical protein
VARDFLAFHRTELTAHMEDEEAVLFPAVEAFDPEGTARLQREHREIHALAARLGDALTGGLDPRAHHERRRVAARRPHPLRERGYFMEAQARLDGPSLRRVGRSSKRGGRIAPRSWIKRTMAVRRGRPIFQVARAGTPGRPPARRTGGASTVDGRLVESGS